MIPKEIKYNLHYDDVRGDVLRPPHGTMLRLRADRGASWPYSSFYVDGSISPVVSLVYYI